MKILKSAHICRATCTVCKCTSKVLKLHNFNAWRRSRWWKTRRRTEVNESRAALLSNLNVFQCTKLAGVYCFLYDLKMILYYWQGFISILGMHDVFYLLSKQPTDQVRMCVSASLPVCKKVAAWDKRSPWASAGCVRGKALAYTRLLLTQYSVFTMWLMEKGSKSQTDVNDVIQCNLNFSQRWPNCKFSRVCEDANRPFALAPFGDITFEGFRLYALWIIIIIKRPQRRLKRRV